jgi:uncharacterized paraquat-inducible protein A
MKKQILITAFALLISTTLLFAQGEKQPNKIKPRETTPELKNDSAYYTCPMHPEVRSIKQGICTKCDMKLVEHSTITTDKRSGEKDALKSYTCSMHPEVKEHQPGKCPACGMELVEKK